MATREIVRQLRSGAGERARLILFCEFNVRQKLRHTLE